MPIDILLVGIAELELVDQRLVFSRQMVLGHAIDRLFFGASANGGDLGHVVVQWHCAIKVHLARLVAVAVNEAALAFLAVAGGQALIVFWSAAGEVS